MTAGAPTLPTSTSMATAVGRAPLPSPPTPPSYLPDDAGGSVSDVAIEPPTRATWGVAAPGMAARLATAPSVSLDQLGLRLEQLAATTAAHRGLDVDVGVGSGTATAAHATTAPRLERFDPSARTPSWAETVPSVPGQPSPRVGGGKVFQNWQWPRVIPPSMPITEVVSNRVLRSLACLKYYLTDGVCGPAVDILSEFPLNRGFEVNVLYTADEFPAWFPIEEVDPDSIVDAEGNSQVAVVVAQWVKARCEELADTLNLVYHMVDLQKEAYVHGDAFLYRVDRIENPAYHTDHSRHYPENTIVELQGLNPTAVWLERNDVGETVRAFVVTPGAPRSFELDLDRLIHLKHKGSSYSTYGFPQVLRALKELMVKEAYLNAAQAWGERYAVPIRMLKYGLLVRAGENSGPIATPAMRQAAEDAIRAYDPTSGATLVAPFHWEYQFVGAEGSAAMAVSNELLEANRRILAALGVPNAFLLGDWSNYATARVQYAALMHRLKSQQEILARILERRIFLPFITMRGYVDPLGQPIQVRVSWKRAHLEDDDSTRDFIAQIAALPGVVSLQTMREMLGLDHTVEEQHLDQEADRVARRLRKLLIVDEQAPSQLPERKPSPSGRSASPSDLPAPSPDVRRDPDASPAPTAPRPIADDPLARRVAIERRLREGIERLDRRLREVPRVGLAAWQEAIDDPDRRAAVERETLRRMAALRLVRSAYTARLAALRRERRRGSSRDQEQD